MAWWIPAMMLAGKMYSSYQSGKSAGQSQNQAYDRIMAQLDKAFNLNVQQALMASGGYGFTNFASYLYRGEYSPGTLQHMSDQKLKQVAKKYDVEPTYRTEYSTGIKRRGGIAGLFGGTKKYKQANKVLNRDDLIAALEPLAVIPFEKEMGQDLMATYDQGLDPDETKSLYTGIQKRYQPSMDAAGRVTSDLFSGQRLQQQLADIRPVEEAERQYVAGMADAYGTQTAEQMNQLRSANLAKYGSASTGLGQRKLEAQLGLASSEALAKMRGDMGITQAGRVADMKEQNRQLKLSNLGMPAQMAQQAAQYATLPTDMMGQYQLRRSGWMNPAAINQPQPQTYTPFEGFKPVASTGQIQSGLMAKVFDQMYKAYGGMGEPGGGSGILGG